MPKLRVSKARERENQRQRKYFRNDLEQPYTDKGKQNPRFEKIYGRKIYQKYEYEEESYPNSN